MSLCLALGSAHPARADSSQSGNSGKQPKSDEATARNLYREAKELKTAGKLSQALEKYREAFEVLPTPTLLWPIAELSLQLGQPIEALDAIRRYRQTMTPELMEPGQQVADAERLEKRCHERLGHVRFAGGNGALVMLDGREIGRAPISDPLAVNPGSHRIDSTSSRGTQTTVVEIGPGEELPVSLSDSPTAAADAGTKSTASSPSSYRIHPLPAVLLGASIASFAAATVIGGLALDKTLYLNDQCPDHLCLGMQGSDLGALNDSVSAQRTYSTASIALWSVGGVLLAGGVVFLVLDLHRQRAGRKLFSWSSLTPHLDEAAASGAKVSSGLLLGGRF